MPKEQYNSGARRRYIEENQKRYKYGEKGGMSLREIAWDIARAFDLRDKDGVYKPPSPATVAKDLERIATGRDRELSQEALELLVPERFPEWRAQFFVAPNGQPYLTPKHQYALFWMIVSLALKQRPPEWVMEYYDFDESVADDIESMEKLLTFILLLAPRHGKTELVLHALIWLIIYNPNIRIIYCQGIQKTSEKVMALIQWELEFNEKLLAMYGPFRGDTYRWNTEEFTVVTRTIPAVSPTFLPIGITTNVRSLSADIIIIDDPQDRRRVDSENAVMKDYSHFTTEIMTRREPHTPVVGVGSHLPAIYGDIWSMLEENQGDLANDGQVIYIRKTPAHDYASCAGDPHIDCILWPEIRPWWFLEAQRAILDGESPGLFDVVYNQLPRAMGTTIFDPETLKAPYIQPVKLDSNGRFLDPIPAEGEVLGVLDAERSWKQWPQCCGVIISAMGFDPAASEAKDGAESALVVRAACARCGRRFLVDYWHRRQSPERNPDTIASYMRSYRPYGLARVRIEINAYQKSLAREPRLRQYARELRFLIDEWTTDDRKNSADLGIPLLAQWMRDGMLSIPAKHKTDLAYGDALLRSFRRYPRTPTDIVMADWLAEVDIGYQLEGMSAHTPEFMPGYEDLPPYLEETIYEIDLGDIWAGDDDGEEYPVLVLG